LRHLADAKVWREFDALYTDFISNPHNARLALASDGFNPYCLMNTTYNTCLVVLIPYNLPPWLFMKPSSFIFSISIPTKSSLRNNIDVYLQPLIHELKLLWVGDVVFDAYSNEYFNMRVVMRCTINNFPTYAMLPAGVPRAIKHVLHVLIPHIHTCLGVKFVI